jgi:hypothetical protein
MDWQYAVSLVGWADLPRAARISAEVRFAVELERVLGSPEAVAAAWATHEDLHGPDRADGMRQLQRAYERAIERAATRG